MLWYEFSSGSGNALLLVWISRIKSSHGLSGRTGSDVHVKVTDCGGLICTKVPVLVGQKPG